MTPDDDYAAIALATLRKAVAETLERKRRLGQYAVIWRDGEILRTGPDAPEPLYPSLDRTEPSPNVAEPNKKG